MRTLLTSICLLFLLFSCNSESKTKKYTVVGDTQIEIAPEYYDFGSLIQGEKVSYTFNIKNMGDKPLLISDAVASCGCTASSYTKEPVAPGKNAQVEVIFDTAGRMGAQYKTVSVYMNTVPKKRTLMFQANVIVK